LPVNDPPSIILPENRTALENQLYSEVIQAQDDDGDNVTLTPQTKPSWLYYNSLTRTLYGTPLSVNIGTHVVRMRASDGIATVDSTFTITVIRVNHPPVITSVPNTSADDYQPYSYTIVATDIDNDKVTFTPITVPSWATFNADSGLLSGTPRYYDTGAFDVSIKASDGYEDTTQSFTIIVANTNDKPFFVSQPDTLVMSNNQYIYNIEVKDVDEDDVLTVSAITLPSWLTYFNQADMLIGRPTDTDIGKALVALEVTDGKAVTEQVFYITVTPKTGIRDNDQSGNIVVYPNPAETSFSILSPRDNLKSLQLFDLNGQCVYYREFLNSSRDVQINGYALTPGIYFYRVVTTSAAFNGKIILK
jgi:large repetitive protein